jgi:3-phenylpropionate/cinnamic acid dioxygenase small subunit
MVTNVEVERIDPASAPLHACFLTTATRRDRQSSFTGRYRDTLVAKGGVWKLKSRLAVLENDMLDGGKITFII